MPPTMRIFRPLVHGIDAAARAAPGTDGQTDTAPFEYAYRIRGRVISYFQLFTKNAFHVLNSRKRF